MNISKFYGIAKGPLFVSATNVRPYMNYLRNWSPSFFNAAFSLGIADGPTP